MSTIVTKADLASYMNKTLVDGPADFVVSAINDWVESETKRVWGQTNQVVERYDYNPRGVFLRNMDIVDVTQIRLGWPNQPAGMSVINASSYYWNEYGRLTMLSPFANTANSTTRFFNDLLEVTYTYGVATVPNDLKLAALGIAAGFYNWAVNGQREITSTAIGSYKVEMSHRTLLPGRKPEQITADANWAVIDKYKLRRV